MKEQINVLISDAHPLERTVIKRSIQKIYPHAVFSEAEDGASTLLSLNKEHFHLAIIDENIPILNGIDVIERYLKDHPNKTRFILTSVKHNYNNYQKGIKMGVNVYVDKGHVDHEIKYGLRAINNGTTFLCDCLTDEISIINSFASKVANLSPNERVFLGELKNGKTIEEISDKLVISNKSVNQITSKICEVIEIPVDKNTLISWAVNHKHYFK